MTEMPFAGALAAMLWATLWFRDSQSLGALLAAAAASNAASLTRYEGWFLIPFVALYLAKVARRKAHAALYLALGSLGPAAWLAHNQFYYSNALEFYDGPYSALAIHERQVAAGVVYPTSHNWRAAAGYYWQAVTLMAGWPALALAGVGAVVALAKRAWWPLVLLALCPLFYVSSLHSGAADLYVSTRWPHTAYNTRYAFPAMLLFFFAAAGVVALASAKWTRVVVLAGVVAIGAPLAAVRGSLSRAEAAVNSAARREAQGEAAAYLAAHYQLGLGIVFPFGTLSGVLRQAGVPLREGLHEGNHPAWEAVRARPGVFLREEWALATPGDEVSALLRESGRQGRPYRLQKRVAVRGAAIEIYRLE
jgi:hypothetical protein